MKKDVRICKECGDPYFVVDYERMNPESRDLCLDCIMKKIEEKLDV